MTRFSGLAVLSFLPANADRAPAQEQSSAKISEQAEAAAGKPVFERFCAPCHGISGGGGRGPRLNRPHLPHAPTDAALRSVIANGIAPGMPDAWYLSDQEIANVAAHIRALGKKPSETIPGNPVRGASVYAQSGCSACHIYAGQGAGFGPDLTDVGERRSASYIRQAIRNPGSALPEGFLMVTAVTSAGKSVTGIRLNEDSFTIQIKDAAGRISSFRKRDLRELEKATGQTPMPAFASILPSADLQDLVAFLATSRETP